MTMSAIPEKKTMTLRLGGKDRAFVLDLAAFAHAEEAYGGPLPIHKLSETIASFRGLHAILYGGLRRRDPSLTIDDFNDMTDLHELEAVSEQVIEAVKSALPREGELPKAAGAEAAASSRSSTSTSRARKTSASRPRSGVN